MPKNRALYDKIGDINWLKSQPEVNVTRALDAILAADPANESEFRKAVAGEANWWAASIKDFLTLPNSLSWVFSNVETFKDHKEFLDPTDGTTFQIIHQKTAEQRVKLGLKNSSEDTLIGILKHNETALRQYIQNKDLGQFNTKKPKGWDVNNTNVLTAEALKNIQQEACEQLLLKLIAKPENGPHLNALLNAGAPELDVAAQKLGFPKEFKLPGRLPDSVTRELPRQIAIYDEAQTKKQFIAHVKNLTSQEVLSLGLALDKDDSGFKTHLNTNEPKFDLKTVPSDWSKGVLGARYLAEVIPTMTSDKAKVLAAINAVDSPNAILALQDPALFGAKAYIQLAVTEDSLPSIKKALLLNLVSNAKEADHENLRELHRAVNQNQINLALGKLGIDPAKITVNPKDMPAIQKVIRERVFLLELDKCSPYGGHQHHAKLIEVFNKLPPESQANLLDKENRQKVRLLVDSTDPKSVEFYIGKKAPETDIDAIVKENKNVAGLRAIHNSAIAKVLSELNVSMTPERAKEINALLVTAHEWDPNPNLLDDFNSYKELIDEIKDACAPISDEAEFYNKFNINPETNAFARVGPNESSKNISNQYQFNAVLLKEYADPGMAKYKKLLDPLLRLEKTKEMSYADYHVTGSKTFGQHFAKSINESESREDFIDRFKNAQIKEQLQREITPAVYAELQEIALKANPELASIKAKQVLDMTQKSHKPFANQLKTIQGKTSKLTLEDDGITITQYKTSDGISPSEVASLQKNYNNLAAECAIAIEQLERNKKDLESRIISNPATEEMIKVNSDITKELESTKQDLQAYKEAKNKLDLAVAQIGKAETAKGHYAFKPDELVVRKEFTRGSPQLRSEASTNPVPLVAVGAEKLPFEYEKIAADKVVRVDVHQKNPEDQTKSVLAGQYTVDMASSDRVMSKGGNTTNYKGGRFELLKFPDPKTNPEGAVKTAMVMMGDVLQRYYEKYGEAPNSKRPIPISGDNAVEIEYLYTALLVYGEKNPNFKFGKDAIRVNSGAFNPDQVKGWFGRHTSDSVYSSVFNDKNNKTIDATITQNVNSLSSWIGDRKQEKEQRKSVEKDLVQETSKLKEKNQSQREEVLKRVDKTGAKTMTQEEYQRARNNR